MIRLFLSRRRLRRRMASAPIRLRRTALSLTAAACASLPAVALAQDVVWPEISIDHNTFRGPGGYLSIGKLVPVLLLFLLWVKTTDWVSRDGQRLKQNITLWNSLVFGCFMAAMLLFWIIPWYALGFVLLLAAYAGPLGAYIFQRDKQVDYEDKVFTTESLITLLRFGNARDPKKLAQEEGPPIELIPRGAASDVDNKANLVRARQTPGWVPAKELLAHALDWRAEAAQMVFGNTSVNVRHTIDGVPRDQRSHGVTANITALAAMKIVAALDENNRVAQQAGEFDVEYQGAKYTVSITTQGVQGGEAALLQFVAKNASFKSFEALGMRPKQAEQFKETMKQHNGLVLFTALPQGGLTTTVDTALTVTDKLTRDFVSVEDARAPEHEIVNVRVDTFDSAAGQGPADLMPKLLRLEPNVIVYRAFSDPAMLQILAEQAQKEILVVGALRSKDAPEAILRALKAGFPQRPLAATLRAVVHQRLIRKLCDTCKVAYVPTPALLQQLGLPADKVPALYRPRIPPTQPDRKYKPCPDCRELGYRGRTALFEVLIIDDTLRKVIAAKPELELLRKAARQAGMQNLQSQGILLAAKGTTSLEEVRRVLGG